MRMSVIVLVSVVVLGAAAAVGLAQRDAGPVTGLRATDQQVTINHRIAVQAMARANQSSSGPSAQLDEATSGPIGTGVVPVAGVQTQPGQSYLVTAWLLVQGQTAANNTFLCFTVDEDGTRGPLASVPVSGVRSMAIAGVFPTPAQGIGLQCDGSGVQGAVIQSGQLSVTEVDLQD